MFGWNFRKHQESTLLRINMKNVDTTSSGSSECQIYIAKPILEKVYITLKSKAITHAVYKMCF